MRIGSESSEAADPFSETALEAISTFGTPPPRTVNRRPPQVRAGPKLSCASYLPSVCGTEGDALGHHAIADEVPQGDQELARQSNDHLLAQAGCILGARAKPVSPRRSPFGNRGNATRAGSCLCALEHCPIGQAFSRRFVPLSSGEPP
jgi:hypothetical protein